MPGLFHDITTGNNFNSTNPNLYSTVAGYDLATPWGTPSGKDLIDALVGYSAGWGAVHGGGTTNLADTAAGASGSALSLRDRHQHHQHYMKTFP